MLRLRHRLPGDHPAPHHATVEELGYDFRDYHEEEEDDSSNALCDETAPLTVSHSSLADHNDDDVELGCSHKKRSNLSNMTSKKLRRRVPIHVAFWKRAGCYPNADDINIDRCGALLPLRLWVALTLFVLTTLFSVRVVYAHYHQLHASMAWSAGMAGLVLAAFGISAFYAVQTLKVINVALEQAHLKEERVSQRLHALQQKETCLTQLLHRLAPPPTVERLLRAMEEHPDHIQDILLVEQAGTTPATARARDYAGRRHSMAGVIRNITVASASGYHSTGASPNNAMDISGRSYNAGMSSSCHHVTTQPFSVGRRSSMGSSSSSAHVRRYSARHLSSTTSTTGMTISTSSTIANQNSSAAMTRMSTGGLTDLSLFPTTTDLFPHTTILQATLSGFAAWSSQRAPAQVFDLLETVFLAFDTLAQRVGSGVLRVETMGDIYIACAGIAPPRRQDHAATLCRFASDCLLEFQSLMIRLETRLGPDTASLGVQVGMTSGPVTAGILRRSFDHNASSGSRFQLFGDTVQQAAELERLSMANQVHLSAATAQLLQESDKAHWVIVQEPSAEEVMQCSVSAANMMVEDLVDESEADALIELEAPQTTYWLDLEQVRSAEENAYSFAPSSDEVHTAIQTPALTKSTSDGSILATSSTTAATSNITSIQEQRLIDWNVEQMAIFLKKIVAKNHATTPVTGDNDATSPTPPRLCPHVGQAVQECHQIVDIPQTSIPTATSFASTPVEPATIVLPKPVLQELHKYVMHIRAMYPNTNPFHNFQHCSHVLQSVIKLVERISSAYNDKCKNRKSAAAAAYDEATFGIASDPLTKFAVVFSALIHDLAHPGVSNAQLVKERTPEAALYHGLSVAEQNSIDVAWNLLMRDGEYPHLVAAICSNSESELARFRQLVVTAVMATDIADADLRASRNQRWEQAWSSESSADGEAPSVSNNRKATIVIETLIQASDISHTMQHFEVFSQWNERLFREMYLAYLRGRSEKDPSKFWFDGEIGFFKYYIIPLAKKLDHCGVFGVSSDEYLTYAERNLQQWNVHGKTMVAQMVARARADYGVKEMLLEP